MKSKTAFFRLIGTGICLALLFTSVAAFSGVSANAVLGDCNKDGKIDCKDVLLMRKYAARVETQIDFEAANINKDNAINAKDVALLRKALANLLRLDEYVVSNTTVITEPSTVPNDALGDSIKTIGETMVSPISNDTYKLRWIDDFDGGTLDESNWSYFTRNYNASEESVNRKENVEINDGLLNIYAKKEDKVYTGSAESWETAKQSNLTSGAINTQGKMSWTYGRLEIKCKIPYSYGMWAAFWTMGVNRGWPWCGETDIMEFVGGTAWGNDRDNEYLSNLHWCDPDLSSDYAWSTSKSVDPLDTREDYDLLSKNKLGCGYTYMPNIKGKLNDEWHICGVEWTDEYMTFYCDDVAYFTVDITRASMRDAFHQPHYLILNLVMGGSWAGTPNEKTVFPQKFTVDWVKVWQK